MIAHLNSDVEFLTDLLKYHVVLGKLTAANMTATNMTAANMTAAKMTSATMTAAYMTAANMTGGQLPTLAGQSLTISRKSNINYQSSLIVYYTRHI